MQSDLPFNTSNLQDEVTRLRERVLLLEQELAVSRRLLLKEFFTRKPLPFSEQELARIVTNQEGLPLEDFIDDSAGAAAAGRGT